MVNHVSFSSGIGRDSAWPHVLYYSSCFVYIMVLLAQNDCQCFRLLIELFASMRMPFECMTVLL